MRATDGAVLIAALVIAWSIYRAHQDQDSAFNLLDLLMENGRLSRLAFAFLVTLCVTSWIMIRLTFDGKITEGYVGLYGAMWVAPIIAKLFSPAPAAGVTTVTDSSIRTQTVEQLPKETKP